MSSALNSWKVSLSVSEGDNLARVTSIFLKALASEPMNGTCNSQRFVTLAYWIKVAFQRKQLTMSELIRCRKSEASCGDLNENDPHRLINGMLGPPLVDVFGNGGLVGGDISLGFKSPLHSQLPTLFSPHACRSDKSSQLCLQHIPAW